MTYTVRNAARARTGLRLRVGCRRPIPTAGAAGPARRPELECARCADLTPGARKHRRAGRAQPKKAMTAPPPPPPPPPQTGHRRAHHHTCTGRQPTRATTRGSWLRVSPGPRIVAVPEIGRPGFVTLRARRGTSRRERVFAVRVEAEGITATAAADVRGRTARSSGSCIILAKDQTGPRVISATAAPGSPR
ncbi:hypothetical protein GCM10023238_12330 [Streptomyces heliomycini]